MYLEHPVVSKVVTPALHSCRLKFCCAILHFDWMREQLPCSVAHPGMQCKKKTNLLFVMLFPSF